MSETIITPPDTQVSPDMRGGVTAGQEIQDPGTVGTAELPVDAQVPVEGEQAAPTVEATEAPVAESVASVLNPGRALARLGARLLTFGERRTTKQVAAEKAGQVRDFTSEKYDNTVAGTKKVATKVGNATLTAGVLTISTGLEKADKLSTAASELKNKAVSSVEVKKDNFVERMKTRATEAQDRKSKRITARAETKAETAKARVEKVMLKDAHSDNKQFDKTKRAEDRRAEMIAKGEAQIKKYAEQDQRRIERNQKIGKAAVAAAKTAGKIGLFTGAAIVAVPAVPAYAAYKSAKFTAEKSAKGARRTIEVAGEVGNAVHVAVRNAQNATGERVNEAMITAQTKRADRLQDKTDATWDKINAREAKSKKRRSL